MDGRNEYKKKEQVQLQWLIISWPKGDVKTTHEENAGDHQPRSLLVFMVFRLRLRLEFHSNRICSFRIG